MVSNQEIVNNLIRNFVDSENTLGKTSSTRIKNSISTEEEIQFNSLARLLTNKGTPQDTCIAIFLKKDGQLLVASNLEEPEYAKGYLKDLKEYIEASSEKEHNEAYEKLVGRAIQQIFYFIRLNQQKRAADPRFERLEEFKSLVINGEKRLDIIRKKMEEVFQEFKENNVNGWRWEYILPLVDTDEVANDIRDRVFGQGVIEAIRGGKIFYIRDKLNMHAEMKILNKLYNRITRTFLEVGYIGITKLCCFPCQTMVYLVNSKMSRDSYFRVCGTHAATYRGWIIPDFYQDEFIESLKRLKKWESSREIPLTLTCNPYGEFERDWASIHRGFRDEVTKKLWSEHFSWSEAKGWFKSFEYESRVFLSPKEDLELVLWMRDKRKLNAYEVSKKRLVSWKKDYLISQQAILTQQLQQVEISPK